MSKPPSRRDDCEAVPNDQRSREKLLRDHFDRRAKVREILNRHKGRHGYCRVTAELRQQGLVVNHKTVQKLMVETQLKSLVRPKRYKA